MIESYTYIKSKSVTDIDGFQTDYTMYRVDGQDKYVFIFGDKDIYLPDTTEPDWECDNEKEANDWFNHYGDDDILDLTTNNTKELY